MTKKHSDMTPAQVKHYQEYYRKYYLKNKPTEVKRKHNNHILLKKKIFQKYNQLGYGSGLSCQIPGCKESSIKNLGFFSTYDNPEAIIYRSLEGADTRYRHLVRTGYPDIGAVSVCMKCFYAMKGAMYRKDMLHKIRGTVKVPLKRSLVNRLKEAFKRPDKELSERGKKSKRLLESWLLNWKDSNRGSSNLHYKQGKFNNPDWLEKKYKTMTMQGIADLCGVSIGTIRNRMNEFGTKRKRGPRP